MQAVVSDKSSCGGVEYAESLGIPTLLFPKPKQAPAGKAALTDEELIHQLTEVLSVDYVLLAGYLKLIPASLIDKYPSRMLNIHPGLLPAFGGKGMYGARVHAAVIQSGARYVPHHACALHILCYTSWAGAAHWRRYRGSSCQL